MPEYSWTSIKQPPVKRTSFVKEASDQCLEVIFEKNGKFIKRRIEHENASFSSLAANS